MINQEFDKVYDLHPAFRDIFDPDLKHIRHIYYCKGRAAGVTWGTAIPIVGECREVHHEVLFTREIQESIKKSSHKVLAKMIRRLGLEGRDEYKITDSEIRHHKTGSLFNFTGLYTNLDKIKSYEGYDIAVVEEAQSVSERSLEVLIPTIGREKNEDGSDKASKIIYSINPTEEEDPVWQRILEARRSQRKDSLIHLMSYKDNWDNLPESFKTEIIEDKEGNPRRYRHVWAGHLLTNSVAQIYNDNWRVLGYDEIKRFEKDIPKTAFIGGGADFGYTKDPACLIIGRVWDNTVYIEHEAFDYGVELDYLPALFAGDCPYPKGNSMYWEQPSEQDYEGLPEAMNIDIVGDNSAPGTISHLKRRGFNIRSSRKPGKKPLMERINFIKNMQIVVHPRCKQIQKELKMYSFKTEKNDKNKLKSPLEPEDEWNHTLDSLGYLLEDFSHPKTSKITGTNKRRRPGAFGQK